MGAARTQLPPIPPRGERTRASIQSNSLQLHSRAAAIPPGDKGFRGEGGGGQLGRGR